MCFNSKLAHLFFSFLFCLYTVQRRATRPTVCRGRRTIYRAQRVVGALTKFAASYRRCRKLVSVGRRLR